MAEISLTDEEKQRIADSIASLKKKKPKKKAIENGEESVAPVEVSPSEGGLLEEPRRTSILDLDKKQDRVLSPYGESPVEEPKSEEEDSGEEPEEQPQEEPAEQTQEEKSRDLDSGDDEGSMFSESDFEDEEYEEGSQSSLDSDGLKKEGGKLVSSVRRKNERGELVGDGMKTKVLSQSLTDGTKISTKVGFTLDIGNLQFFRVDAGLELPTTKDKIPEAYAEAWEVVKAEIARQVAEIKNSPMYKGR